MSEHAIGHRPIDWGAIGVIASVLAMIGAGFMVFGGVSEKQANAEKAIVKLQDEDREHTAAINEMRRDRTLETKINDLTLEVRLLRQQVEQSNEKRKR